MEIHLQNRWIFSIVRLVFGGGTVMLLKCLFFGGFWVRVKDWFVSHTASAREDTSMAKIGMLRCSCVQRNVSNLNDDLSI